MAARRRFPLPARPLSVLATTFGLAVAGLVTLPATPGSATPTLSIQEVQARIAALNVAEERVVEQYDAAQVALAADQRRVAVLHDQVVRDQKAADALRVNVNDVAAAAYRTGGAGQLMSLLTSPNPQTFVDQASDLEQISHDQALGLQAFEVARHSLAEAQGSAARALAGQQATERKIAGAKASIQSTLAAEQALLNRLNAQARAEMAAAAARAAAAASAARAAAAQQAAPAPTPAPTPVNVSADGRAGTAVRFAYAQLGKPYQWGGSGPGAYDCSGLTMSAWGAAGVSLPHSAAGQQATTTPVPGGALQPGDLIFFGAPAYHVGIYVGNGSMIDAPHSGAYVETAPIGGYTSAGRP